MTQLRNTPVKEIVEIEACADYRHYWVKILDTALAPHAVRLGICGDPEDPIARLFGYFTERDDLVAYELDVKHSVKTKHVKQLLIGMTKPVNGSQDFEVVYHDSEVRLLYYTKTPSFIWTVRKWEQVKR